MQTREKQNQEHEAIFPTVIGQRQFRERVAGESSCEDVEGDAGLALDGREEGIWGVVFGQERMDSVVEGCDDGGEGSLCLWMCFRFSYRVGFLQVWGLLWLLELGFWGGVVV